MTSLFQRSMVAAASVLALLSILVSGCGDGIIEQTPHSGSDTGSQTLQVDAGAGGSDGPLWANEKEDAGGAAAALTPNSLTVNVGINRDIVPGYPGDSCDSIARFLVLDVTGPSGTLLQHVDLDCQQGANGWTYYNVAAGHFTATMQLFDADASGNRVAATPTRTASSDLTSGQGALIWVDYTYKDFTTSYQGDLRWKVAWISDGAAHGCKDAQPAVVTERLTIHNDQGQLVSARTVSPSGGSLATDGSTTGLCSDYGSSDAEVLPNVAWGIYTVKIEGLNVSGAVSYCVQRQLFSTKGDGIIYAILAPQGTC